MSKTQTSKLRTRYSKYFSLTVLLKMSERECEDQAAGGDFSVKEMSVAFKGMSCKMQIVIEKLEELTNKNKEQSFCKGNKKQCFNFKTDQTDGVILKCGNEK